MDREIQPTNIIESRDKKGQNEEKEQAILNNIIIVFIITC